MNFDSYLTQNGIEFAVREPMSKHTTFRIGGEVDYYISPKSKEQLIGVMRNMDFYEPFFICGNLSNTVFADEGYHGTVIDTRGLCEVRVSGNEIICGAGASLTAVAKTAAENGLSGLEFAYGIPGTVGGGVVMNAGAYGGQLSDVVKSVTFFDVEEDEVYELPNEKCNFDYRRSIFSSGGLIILSCVLSLKSGNTEEIVSLMEENMRARREKQPLDMPNAGSVFKRPQGAFVGKMIEDLGLKGYRCGDIAISDKHAGFMVNCGGGTCAQLKELISFVKEKVFEEYGISLECEICFVG